jgi:hypothetical protein
MSIRFMSAETGSNLAGFRSTPDRYGLMVGLAGFFLCCLCEPLIPRGNFQHNGFGIGIGHLPRHSYSFGCKCPPALEFCVIRHAKGPRLKTVTRGELFQIERFLRAAAVEHLRARA